MMYVAITRAKERLYLTRSKSRYLYGKREPSARSRFLKELSTELDLPKETRSMPVGYGDWDDPESYGNSAYGGGRYATNGDFGGRRTSFGGGYGSSNSSSYGGYGSRNTERENSAVKRSAWNGNSYGSSYGNSYGSSSYGSSYDNSYGNSTAKSAQGSAKSSGGFTYGGVGKPIGKPTSGKDLSAFKVGVRVKHLKFGVGTIVNVRGMGSNMIVDVAFEGLGIKQLSANLAPLTVL